MARREVLNSAGVVDQDYGFGNKSIQDSIYVAIPSPLSRRWRADPATYRREPPGRDARTVSGPGARPGGLAGLAAAILRGRAIAPGRPGMGRQASSVVVKGHLPATGLPARRCRERSGSLNPMQRHAIAHEPAKLPLLAGIGR